MHGLDSCIQSRRLRDDQRMCRLDGRVEPGQGERGRLTRDAPTAPIV